MQDRYVGDVGDFGKYSLLRKLAAAGDVPLRLGVVWYRYPDEAHNGDGRHVAYLGSPAFASLDPELHEGLARLVASRRRAIASVENSGLLPDGTSYHGVSTVGLLGEGSMPHQRAAYRSAWLDQAIEAVAGADLAFLDPDNGIASPIASRDGPKAGKYAFLDEVAAFWRRGHSLVVYHHLNRTAPHKAQVATLAERLAKAVGRPAFLCPVVLKRGSCRVFWVVGQRAHAARLEAGVRSFVEAGWHAHCDAAPTRISLPGRNAPDPAAGAEDLVAPAGRGRGAGA